MLPREHFIGEPATPSNVNRRFFYHFAYTAAASTSSYLRSTVPVKPSNSMATYPAAWFTVMEAQFHLAHNTSSVTRFYHALAALPPETVAQLSQTSLASQDYNTLKMNVI